MKLLQQFLRTIDKTNEWVAKVLSFLIIVIILATIYEVIMRYFFGAPTIWAFEFNYLVYGPYFLLAGAYTLALGKHVNVDILYGKLSARRRAIVDLITAPVFFFFIYTMLVYGWRFAWNSVLVRETLSSAWGPPVYPIKLCIPLAALLLLLQGISKFVRDFHLAITNRELSS
ncbi:MAG: TRAP transporter small permease subunit [Desulfomonilia bacterium]|nr:TRAP transporter small permease subunit [Desulfomonilia bacterium]